MRKIEYIDLAQQWSTERKELLPLIDQVLSDGMWVGGEVIYKFEKLVCNYTGAKYCVSLNSECPSIPNPAFGRAIWY